MTAKELHYRIYRRSPSGLHVVLVATCNSRWMADLITHVVLDRSRPGFSVYVEHDIIEMIA